MNIFNNISLGPLKTDGVKSSSSVKMSRGDRVTNNGDQHQKRFSDHLADHNNRLATQTQNQETKSSPRSTPGVSSGLDQIAKEIDTLRRDGKRISSLINRAEKGRSMSPREILIWQSRVYNYSQRIDLASRVVDKSLSTLRTLTQIQI